MFISQYALHVDQPLTDPYVLIQMLSSDSNDLDGEEEDQHEDDELASKVYVSVSARSSSFAGSVSATVL